tara:strand:- start:132 stop:314 length:183 start_codon:yes stop_codon:yes gene_type:complete
MIISTMYENSQCNYSISLDYKTMLYTASGYCRKGKSFEIIFPKCTSYEEARDQTEKKYFI